MASGEPNRYRRGTLDAEDGGVAREKSPDDHCFEGGNCDSFGPASAIVGDLRSLSENDNPDDLDVEFVDP